MGNFHCIPSSCVEVRYQSYKKPVQIRYRYPGQDWIVVDGDDYTIDSFLDFGDTPFHIYLTGIYNNPFLAPHPFTYETGDSVTAYAVTNNTSGFISYVSHKGKIIDYQILDQVVDDPGANSVKISITTEYQGVRQTQIYDFFYNIRVAKRPGPLYWSSSYSFGTLLGITEISDVYFLGFDGITKPVDTCDFTIYKNGLIVHQETRSDCPEVEKVEVENNTCELDITRVITIDKIPFLERVEVVPYAYQNFGLNVFQGKIPDECLNIYNNLTTTIIPQFEGFGTPSNSGLITESAYNLITQICSSPNCPPPKYEVICDCDTEECPAGSCPVACGDVVCCYDTTTGKAVDQIPLENYGGQL